MKARRSLAQLLLLYQASLLNSSSFILLRLTEVRRGARSRRTCPTHMPQAVPSLTNSGQPGDLQGVGADRGTIGHRPLVA